jgi:hypothetical protein
MFGNAGVGVILLLPTLLLLKKRDMKTADACR